MHFPLDNFRDLIFVACQATLVFLKACQLPKQALYTNNVLQHHEDLCCRLQEEFLKSWSLSDCHVYRNVYLCTLKAFPTFFMKFVPIVRSCCLSSSSFQIETLSFLVFDLSGLQIMTDRQSVFSSYAINFRQNTSYLKYQLSTDLYLRAHIKLWA